MPSRSNPQTRKLTRSRRAAKRAPAAGPDLLRTWFDSKGWSPRPFQSEVWTAYADGRSGLVHVPTGAGKTYAAYGGPLADLLGEAATGGADGDGVSQVEGLRILFVTPLRAVSRDIENALRLPIEDLGLFQSAITVQSRTGDTSSSVRAKQKTTLPNILITTPESLTLLLTQPDAAKKFAPLRCIILDEWHELLSSKRGTQVELACARLRRFSPGVRTWALSATLSNLDVAAQAAVGEGTDPVLISADIDRPVIIETVLPDPGDPFPWAGHLGLTQLPRVIDAIPTGADGLPTDSTLVFVNTRSQAERWHHALHATKPDWADIIAIHHGSLDRDERERVEAGLKDGSVRVVVATSSLDLGVDFAPVERVMQIGSPKGIARLMQRAGRASHRPGAPCTVVCVPTNALEFVEVAAVRRSIASGRIEPRAPENMPLDVLSQHMVSIALGGGFRPNDLFDEVRTAHAYRDLPRDAFDWTLDLVTRGGETLAAYPEYHKVIVGDDGLHTVTDKRIATLHRFNVGTITGDAVMEIRYLSGKRLGSIEESFVQKLRRGETFVFAGKTLRYEKTRDLTAYVRPASGKTTHTPIWSGTRLPISESLSQAVREAIEAVRDHRFDPEAEPELAAAERFVSVQAALSALPSANETLVEICETREGHHLFVYPFEGRLVHGALAALLALRLSRREKASFSMAFNDYGFELLSEAPYPFASLLSPGVFTPDDLAADAVESVNLSALAKGQFREIARVSGLVFQSYPGAKRKMAHVEARAGLIYDVLEQFDPENLLLHQARREVLEKQFEQSRLGRTLQRLESSPMLVKHTQRPTPLSLPLVIERVGARLSSESILDRIEKMQQAWERAGAIA